MDPDPIIERLKILQERLLELAEEASELRAKAEARKPPQWPSDYEPAPDPTFSQGPRQR